MRWQKQSACWVLVVDLLNYKIVRKWNMILMIYLVCLMLPWRRLQYYYFIRIECSKYNACGLRHEPRLFCAGIVSFVIALVLEPTHYMKVERAHLFHLLKLSFFSFVTFLVYPCIILDIEYIVPLTWGLCIVDTFRMKQNLNQAINTHVTRPMTCQSCDIREVRTWLNMH